ncbi:MAG: hypothetical protein ACXWL2_02360 [Candidatus Chromulinivorax sp.]
MKLNVKIIVGVVIAAAIAGFVVHRYMQKNNDNVKIQGFNGIGIGGGNFALGFGQTDNGKPVVGIPWGKGNDYNDNEDDDIEIQSMQSSQSNTGSASYIGR